jgi:large subunit ribosomal protein L3
MAIGILGKKIGMTQVYTDQGKWVPVTVIEAGPCDVVQLKTQSRDGYEAAQLGFGQRKEKNTTKPLLGHFKKAGTSSKRFIREIRIESEEDRKVYSDSKSIKVDQFSEGDCVDITGTTIGKGFQGGMKRWGWRGGKATHGSMTHRRPGSIGASSFPSRVFRGHHMPGQMGNVVRTVQNIEIVQVDVEKNLLVVKGQIPGHRNNYLLIRRAKKKKRRKERIHSDASKQKTVKKTAKKGK